MVVRDGVVIHKERCAECTKHVSFATIALGNGALVLITGCDLHVAEGKAALFAGLKAANAGPWEDLEKVP